MEQQYWADAGTRNCVWLFQVVREGVVSVERVYLSRKEARQFGKENTHNYGKEDEGWGVYGVPCVGIMAELLGRHAEEFEHLVHYIGTYKPVEV